jgi:hypothetical protein
MPRFRERESVHKFCVNDLVSSPLVGSLPPDEAHREVGEHGGVRQPMEN